ncbi:MAG: indole-3-glycerol phosphate synthase TrpC [Phascolarctobacterium sp.]|nr:indole-3-glycerol phosphate synthase TrpC [Phascolarctobacterium sp.]
MTILDTIAAHAKVRVANDKKILPLEVMKEMIQGQGAGNKFVEALKKPGISFICEIKKASPSKGIIAENFPYRVIAQEYEAAGAEAISCLTEPKWFLGSDEIFKAVRSLVITPMLRKDFTVDPYQIYQARLLGANAVLLITSLMDTKSLYNYLELCDELGLAALVETHDEKEIVQALSAGAQIIGVNNRNLKDFSVDINNSKRLREIVGTKAIYVAESGIKTAEDVAELKNDGVDAVLIGETLMRAKDKKAMLQELRG